MIDRYTERYSTAEPGTATAAALQQASDKVADKVTDLADTVGERADDALIGARRFTADTVESVKGGVEHARRVADSTLQRAAGKLDEVTHRAMDGAKRLSHDAYDKALTVRDRSTDYIRDEPMKSVLLAVAAGAALAVAVNLMTRSRHH